MGNLTHLAHYNNLMATNANVRSSSVANTTYALSNLTAMPISKAFRFSGHVSEWFAADFDQPYYINLIALINHNLTDTATVTVQAGTSPFLGGFSQSMLWRQYDQFYYTPIAQFYQFWQVTIADPDNTKAIEIGYAMIGLATEFSFNFTYGWHIADTFENNTVETEFGVRHVVELFSRVRIQMEFRNLSGTNMNNLRLVARSFKRNLNPLFLIPDSSISEGYFVRHESDFERVLAGPLYNGQTAEMYFLEESRGKRLGA